MKTSYILMADVIKSRQAKGAQLAKELSTVIALINKNFKKDISSPLTVTLGGEFQGIINSRTVGLQIIVSLEELLVEKQILFKLRYVLGRGKIETPINKKIAHGMLGEGLTTTREILDVSKKNDDRFQIVTGQNEEIINKYFILFQSIIDDWKPKDLKIVSDFLKTDDYKIVAEKNKKNWSQMWKRKKSLKIKEYNIIRQLILASDGNN